MVNSDVTPLSVILTSQYRNATFPLVSPVNRPALETVEPERRGPNPEAYDLCLSLGIQPPASGFHAATSGMQFVPTLDSLTPTRAKSEFIRSPSHSTTEKSEQ